MLAPAKTNTGKAGAHSSAAMTPISRLNRLHTWLNRGITAIFFLSLVALSNVALRDVEKLEPRLTQSEFRYPRQGEIELLLQKQRAELSQAQGQWRSARGLWEGENAALSGAEKTFGDWARLREASQDARANAQMQQRLGKLEAQRQRVQTLREKLAEADRRVQEMSAEIGKLEQEQSTLQRAVAQKIGEESARRALKTFGLRLIFVAPILLAGIFAFARWRRSRYAPLVHGFALFALYVFFFGLVPYLPDFGGYIRYGAASLLVLVGGVYSIRHFNAFLERKRSEIEVSQEKRAQEVTAEKALNAYRQKFCPSCGQDYTLPGGAQPRHCFYCGIELFHACDCGAVNFRFFRFCPSCGKRAALEVA